MIVDGFMHVHKMIVKGKGGIKMETKVSDVLRVGECGIVE